MGAAIGFFVSGVWVCGRWNDLRERQKKVCLLSGCAWMSRVPRLTFHSECIQPRMSRFVAQKATTWKEDVRDDRNGTAFLKSIRPSSSLNDLIRVFLCYAWLVVVIGVYVVTFWLFCSLVKQCIAVLSDSLVGMYTARWALALAACAPHGSRQVWREERTHFFCQTLMFPQWWDPHVMIYVYTMYTLDTVWVRQDIL